MSCGAEVPILRRVLARRTPLLAALFAAAASGQEPEAQVTVAALTHVPVRIEQAVSSKTSKSGDRFPITVAEDVRVGDALVIPAGSAGEGEVIHAARSGAGGKAGELILAARYVRVGDREIRLRSFVLGVAGKDQANNAFASSFVIGPFAMFVKGGVVIVPAGTVGLAKTALEFQLPALRAAPAPELQSVEETKGGDDENKTD